MPTKPPTIKPAGWVPPVVKRKEYRAIRGNAQERGYNGRWQQERKRFLELNPICICGCGGLATRVDHRIPHKGNMQLFWDKSNWQPMTERCHNRKTALENGLGLY